MIYNKPMIIYTGRRTDIPAFSPGGTYPSDKIQLADQQIWIDDSVTLF